MAVLSNSSYMTWGIHEKKKKKKTNVPGKEIHRKNRSSMINLRVSPTKGRQLLGIIRTVRLIRARVQVRDKGKKKKMGEAIDIHPHELTRT